MNRILVAGLCPLPFENARKTYGPGIRSWQFARSLAHAGHTVRLIAMRIDDTYEDGAPREEEEREGVSIRRVPPNALLRGQAVAEEIATFGPDAVVGATIYGSYALARSAPAVPFWADQFGHVMSEAQAKAFLHGRNWPLAYFWKLVAPVLARADRISAVSERQRWALIGELGAVGRLTAEACGYEFTALIPCGYVLPVEPQPPAQRRPRLRGVRCPEEAFLALWSGSYNTWTDVDTLFAGLELAMRARPRLRYVSTGGAISGHDESTYARLRTRVDASPFCDRFHFDGWLPAETVPSYFAECDLGVVAERRIYEGMLGSKNRLVQWMGAGLPVLYNQVGDLGDLLATHSLALTFPVGDAEALSGKLVWAVDHPKELRSIADAARRFAHQQLSFAATTRELVAWAAAPERAPGPAPADGLSPARHATLGQRLKAALSAIPALERSALVAALRNRYDGMRRK